MLMNPPVIFPGPYSYACGNPRGEFWDIKGYHSVRYMKVEGDMVRHLKNPKNGPGKVTLVNPPPYNGMGPGGIKKDAFQEV